MSFKNQLSSDAVNVFLNNDESAEEITYIPKSGSSKPMKAIATRHGTSPGRETDRILQNQMEIEIANDEVYGVTSVNQGGDKVSIPEHVGGSAVEWSVADILASDDGMWHLLLQK